MVNDITLSLTWDSAIHTGHVPSYQSEEIAELAFWKLIEPTAHYDFRQDEYTVVVKNKQADVSWFSAYRMLRYFSTHVSRSTPRVSSFDTHQALEAEALQRAREMAHMMIMEAADGK